MKRGVIMKKVKFNPGFLSGVTLAIDENFVKYTGMLGGVQAGSVPIKSIKAITVEPGVKPGSVQLKFIGDGTSLGALEMAINYAQKSQLWLMEQLNL
jgi:hypothetical protein